MSRKLKYDRVCNRPGLCGLSRGDDVADIILDDLLHWQRGLTVRPPVGVPRQDAIERGMSWAVTLRASAPVLPPLRGGEIVIAPPRILEQIRAAEMIDQAALIRQLGDQPIAALMVDPSFSEGPVAGVTLLVTSGTFPHDAEATLNRLITERRADLYRLGSDLTRALSTVTLAGVGIDALLDAAESLTRTPLLLIDAQLMTIARSRSAGDDVRLVAADVAALLQAGTGGARVLSGTDGRQWLAHPVVRGASRIPGHLGQEDELLLLISHGGDGPTEVDRLIIGQTAAAIDLLLGQPGGIDALPRGRSSREPLVADLLLGRLSSHDAAESRARLLGLDPGARVRVALVAAGPVVLSRVRSMASDDRRRLSASISEGELALILIGDGPGGTDWQRVEAFIAATADREDSTKGSVLATSDAVAGAAQIPAALDQARTLVRLIKLGTIVGPVIHADDLDHLGIAGLFLPIVSQPHATIDVGQMQTRIDAFALSLLGPLEDHDARRGSDLVATLVAYLNLGGALAQAADVLGVHRNTLSYRLNRVAELTDRDLNDPHTRFLFQIAVSIRALQRAGLRAEG